MLIEDNPGDIHLIKESLYLTGKQIEFSIFNDGEEAITCINVNCAQPDLIILDINLPYHNGFTVLESIKNNPVFTKIPTVIFSSSDQLEDRNKALKLGADKYYTKPYSFNEYSTTVQSFLKLKT